MPSPLLTLTFAAFALIDLDSRSRGQRAGPEPDTRRGREHQPGRSLRN